MCPCIKNFHNSICIFWLIYYETTRDLNYATKAQWHFLKNRWIERSVWCLIFFSFFILFPLGISYVYSSTSKLGNTIYHVKNVYLFIKLYEYPFKAKCKNECYILRLFHRKWNTLVAKDDLKKTLMKQVFGCLKSLKKTKFLYSCTLSKTIFGASKTNITSNA